MCCKSQSLRRPGTAPASFAPFQSLLQQHRPSGAPLHFAGRHRACPATDPPPATRSSARRCSAPRHRVRCPPCHRVPAGTTGHPHHAGYTCSSLPTTHGLCSLHTIGLRPGRLPAIPLPQREPATDLHPHMYIFFSRNTDDELQKKFHYCIAGIGISARMKKR
jgi:hypothetical protein